MVRAMKGHSPQTTASLFAAVREKLAASPPDEPELQEALERLISHEYITRDEADPKIVHYVT